MRTQSIDTTLKAEEFLVSLYRNACTTKKFSQVRSLSKTITQLSRRAIARANKDLTERQIDILFVAYHYGKELANSLEKYLDTIDHENS
ncbi:hypothetical protein KAX22_04610 [bacterium]|nr:hypothetical protein [bacterium]